MRLLPRESYVVETDASVDTLVARLSPEVQAPKLFEGFREHRTFSGTVSREGFRLVRIIRHRNAFLPVSVGRFEQTVDGTRVHVTMRMRDLVKGLMGVWFGTLGMFGLAALAFLGGALGHGGSVRSSVGFLALVVAMFVFGQLLMRMGFRVEAKRARERITTLLGEKGEGKRGGSPFLSAVFVRILAIGGGQKIAAAEKGASFLLCFCVSGAKSDDLT